MGKCYLIGKGFGEKENVLNKRKNRVFQEKPQI